MKRIHIGMRVDDIESSSKFYSALFGIEPSVVKDDYAKWMLDDPRVNFSISTHCDTGGAVHFGVQVESSEELSEVTGRLRAAGVATQETPGATCCYAKSDKTWTADPEGHLWETFLTHGLTTVYGDATLETVEIDALVAGTDASATANEKKAKTGGCCGSAA